MSDWIVRVESVGKRYRLRHQQARGSYVTIREVVSERVKGLFRKQKSSSARTEDFWAVKNVSFEIKRGEVVGIIGRNGAGKSTLLKVLSRITAPSAGRLRLRGRVASLLEVGTGFHPELTGRENIFLNGSILGMTKAEIRRKFDEIVAFSEIAKFLDTPVKRYSSGMYVRLAFAVAAHLEPEILVVDEVLAVGDAEFQKKCLGKMHDVASAGRTVLFVSHNLQAVSLLCSRALLLSSGSLAYDGAVREGIEQYVSGFANGPGSSETPARRPGTGEYRYTRVSPTRSHFGSAEDKTIDFEIERYGNPVGKMWLSAFLVDPSGAVVIQCDSRLVDAVFSDFERLAGQLRLRSPWLKPGSYRIDLFICATGIVDFWEGAGWLNISPILPYRTSISEDGIKAGMVFADFSWQTAQHRPPAQAAPLRVVQVEESSRGN
jgi:lipopolysaccharide transport system ATP-binding protein